MGGMGWTELRVQVAVGCEDGHGKCTRVREMVINRLLIYYLIMLMVMQSC